MHQRLILVLAATAIAVVWQLPFGRQLLYPLTLLSTFAHELGHGLTALLMGAHFDHLQLNADGSGSAVWHGNPGPLAIAAIAAGGLIGPSLAGVSLLMLARSTQRARGLLALLAVLLLVSMAVWARNAFGIFFLLTSAAALALAVRYLCDVWAALLLNLIAVTLCLSWFTDLDYMFSSVAVVNGVRYPSDSAAMAQALWLPYWFWGGLVAVVSLVVLAVGLLHVGRTSRG
ncbi:MAG: M50 family metallopeptidase [Candidatus Saccharibacteria bacterium]|nr:M50 family metallopeptidase [Rhodoferax sp.]